MEDIHKELEIPALNVRISKLNSKTLNKIKEICYVTRNTRRFERYSNRLLPPDFGTLYLLIFSLILIIFLLSRDRSITT